MKSVPASSSRWVRARVTGTIVVLSSALSLVVYRAYRLQVEEGSRLSALAQRQSSKHLELSPRRGMIVDRHGSTLAVSVEVDSIYANPRLAGKHASIVAHRLSSLLAVDSDVLRRRLLSSRYFVWVKRRVTPTVAKKVRQAKLPGVFITQENRRFYPNRQLAAKVIGFAGYDARGLEGIELSYDRQLRGRARRIKGLRDALGRPVLSDGRGQAEAAGQDVVLSLDLAVQHVVEQALASSLPMVREGGWLGAVVMDPHSGDILAMADVPTFDPNQFQRVSAALRRNRVVVDTFEPGSTIKAFSAAAALQHRTANPDTAYDCHGGSYRVGRHTIHDSKPHRILTLRQVLAKSSNIGVAKLAAELGALRLSEMLVASGFGSRTGVPLPGERSGRIRSWKRWSDVGLANIAFGQGLTTTVLQLAQGFSILGNGGHLVRPRLALAVRGGKRTRRISPERGQRAMRREVAQEILSMLRSVTRPGGTATTAALERYTVAGKTGTAQKVDPKTGTYADDAWVASFVGLVPASRPRLTIAVVVNEPRAERHQGGEVAGPIFASIAAQTLAYLGVRPDRPADTPATPRTIVAAPPLPKPVPIGAGGTPNFGGMSISEALRTSRDVGVAITVVGSGRAVAQSPLPGKPVPPGGCRVEFRPPG